MSVSVARSASRHPLTTVLSPGFAAAVAGAIPRSVASRTGRPPTYNPWNVANDAVALMRVAQRSIRDTPLGDAADIAFAGAALVRGHPAIRAFQAALIIRELALQRLGVPAVSSALAGYAVPGGGAWQFTGNWDNALPCVGGPQGPFGVLVNGSGCLGESFTYFQLWPPATLQEMISANGGLFPGQIAAFGSARDSGVPNYIITTQNEAWVYQGNPLPPPATEELPVFIPAVGAAPVASRGLNDPTTDLARMADAARGFGLPGFPLPVGRILLSEWELIHGVREALGLREVSAPSPPGRRNDPERDPGPSRRRRRERRQEPVKGTPEPSPWPRNELGPLSGMLVRGVWRQASAHKFRPDRKADRTAKLKAKYPFAFRVLMRAFTESNDFIEGIWKTLPRNKRTAGMTRTGNRRSDSMLRDIYNAFDLIDWNEALGNVVSNEVEDLLIGLEQRAWNRSSQTSGQGQGTHNKRAQEHVEGFWGDALVDRVQSSVANAGRRTGFGDTVRSGIRRLRNGV